MYTRLSGRDSDKENLTSHHPPATVATSCPVAADGLAREEEAPTSGDDADVPIFTSQGAVLYFALQLT